jgi:hypothetical protein
LFLTVQNSYSTRSLIRSATLPSIQASRVLPFVVILTVAVVMKLIPCHLFIGWREIQTRLAWTENLQA